jgi:hypothetical protein
VSLGVLKTMAHMQQLSQTVRDKERDRHKFRHEQKTRTIHTSTEHTHAHLHEQKHQQTHPHTHTENRATKTVLPRDCSCDNEHCQKVVVFMHCSTIG